MKRDLVNTTLMAAAFKIGLEERTNDVQGLYRGDESGRQSEDIRIVMLARQLR